MTSLRFRITAERKKEFAALYLLDYMIHTSASLPLLLEGNDQDLEPVLEWLLAKKYIAIEERQRYVPAATGRQALAQFTQRYLEFLRTYDVFSAVDLEAGVFAFSHYHDFDDPDQWRDFLADERWDDLRVAVADYLGQDPVEVVFMSFINENRFGRDQSGWQFDLLLGSVWDEILQICNSAISWRDLGYASEAGPVRAEDVMTDIIRQGRELMQQIQE